MDSEELKKMLEGDALGFGPGNIMGLGGAKGGAMGAIVALAASAAPYVGMGLAAKGGFFGVKKVCDWFNGESQN